MLMKLLMFFLGQGLVVAYVVLMKKKMDDGMITVSCTVDHFTSDVNFIYPNSSFGYGYCIVPVSSETNCSCICASSPACKCTINQDIATKTTILQIRDKNLTRMYGRFTCTHGSFQQSIIVERSNTTTHEYAGCPKHSEAPYTIVLTMALTTVSIGIFVSACMFFDIPRNIKKLTICGAQTITAVNPSKKSDACASCNEFSICGFCVECTKYYCDICSKFHLKENPKHRICQIQNVTNSKMKITCKSCCIFTRSVERLCKNCEKLFCVTCAHSHLLQFREHVMLKIDQAPLKSRLDKTEIIPERLNRLHTLSFQPVQDDDNPVRILGIAYLTGDTIVVIDANNCKLILFKSTDSEDRMQVELENEPCALTRMTGNTIAITYPNSKLIRIYVIDMTQNTAKEVMKIHKNINMRTFSLDNCTPFSIAYNDGFFAIEVGKSGDGKIIIFDIDNSNIIKHVKSKLANFTGESIRIALLINKNNTDEGRLFVSAIGKKTVFCMDLDGNELCHISIPSPRSIIVSEDYLWDQNIMFSCRRGNAIYRLTKNEGQNGDEWEIFKVADKIRSPRYMAFQPSGKKLCVLVENENSHEDELAVFEINDPEPSESTTFNV